MHKPRRYILHHDNCHRTTLELIPSRRCLREPNSRPDPLGQEFQHHAAVTLGIFIDEGGDGGVAVSGDEILRRPDGRVDALRGR